MGCRGGEADAREAGFGTVRSLVLLLGTLLLAAGVVVVATNYSDDYSCYTDLECYGDRTEPTVVDRTMTAFGFGEGRADSDLPGAEGTLMIALGAAVLLLVVVARPGHSHDDAVVDAPIATPAPVPRGEAIEQPGPRQRVFIDR